STAKGEWRTSPFLRGHCQMVDTPPTERTGLGDGTQPFCFGDRCRGRNRQSYFRTSGGRRLCSIGRGSVLFGRSARGAGCEPRWPRRSPRPACRRDRGGERGG